jgi:hypothetical protein
MIYCVCGVCALYGNCGPFFQFFFISSFLHFFISSFLYSFPTIMSALSLLYRGRLGPDRVKNDVFYRDCVSNRTPLCSILATNFSAKLGVHVILASCVCAYLIIFSGGLPISSDIHLEVFHSYRARQPPFLTSITSIFGHNVDLVFMYIFIYYIYYIYYIYVLVFPWFYLVLGQSLGFFTHNL